MQILKAIMHQNGYHFIKIILFPLTFALTEKYESFSKPSTNLVNWFRSPYIIN